MPEMRFQIEWPDGVKETCYSPSLVIKDYLLENHEYAVDEFVALVRTALTEASDRVQAKYGFPCGRATAQLQQIEMTASQLNPDPDLKVRVIQFLG